MKEITWKELLSLFDPIVHDALTNPPASIGATHMVVFENLQLDSSHIGERTGVFVGTNCDFKTLAQVNGRWLKDLPSQRQYPVAFAAIPSQEVSEFKEEPQERELGRDGLFYYLERPNQ